MHTTNVTRLPLLRSLTGDDCRLLVDSVADYALFLMEPDGKVATWNLGAQRINGYRADEIVGADFARFFTPEDVEAGKPHAELAAARERGRVEDEGWRVRKDGARFWANVITTALHDETGALRGYGSIVRDLTERHESEIALRASEQRFHGLVDAITDYAIFMLDTHGHVATWNKGAMRLKGYAADEMVGQHFSAFYTPEDRAAGRPARLLATAAREGRVEDEGWRVRKDGTRFWANVVITALFDDSGRLFGYAKVTRDLTDRRAAEERLQRSEERFRLLVEGVTDYALYMLDPTGRVATWNVGAQRLKGYAADEIIGKHFACFFPEEDVQSGKPARELGIALSEGRFEEEAWRLRKDGTRFWANIVLTAVRDEHGALQGFVKITRDLTARREKEEAQRALVIEAAARAAAERSELRLRESEERYRALSRRLEVILESVADGITVENHDGKILFANNASAAAYGFASTDDLIVASPEDLNRRFELLDVSGRPLSPELLPGRRAMRNEPARSIELRVRERATGKETWSVVRSTPVLAPNGEPEYVVNVWHDVTDERRRERRTKVLADASVLVSDTFDIDTVGDHIPKLFVPAFADVAVLALHEGGEPRTFIAASRDADRDRAKDLVSAETVFRPDIINVTLRIRDEAVGSLSLGLVEGARTHTVEDFEVAQEVARRIAMAIAQARSFRDAQHAATSAAQAARRAEEANRVKDEFLATVSHELRTPLNAILGWATILQKRSLDDAVRNAIQVIHRNAHAQAKIIEDILDVSRIISGKLHLKLAAANLVQVVSDALAVVRPSAVAKRVELVFEPPGEPLMLVADVDRLQQVVWNLLSNAVKFTDPGGRVVIEVVRAGSRMSIVVRDTGRGIAPGFLPYVFDRFQQADSSTTREFGGLGLGLSIVRHIVELHGGQVEAESEGEGKGATFRVSLPVRAVARREELPTTQPAETSPRSVRAALDLSGVRVLVVDDELDARELVSAVLSEVGATVETAMSAEEGLDVARRFRPQIVISDIGMPAEDGFSFVRRLRKLSPEEGGAAPAIALTAYSRAEDRRKALACGFTTMVAKPADPDDILATVANLRAFVRP